MSSAAGAATTAFFSALVALPFTAGAALVALAFGFSSSELSSEELSSASESEASEPESEPEESEPDSDSEELSLEDSAFCCRS